MLITIIGNVCIDKNTVEQASYISAGGPAVFMQKVFSQIPSTSTTIVTPYGNDFLSVAPELSLFPTQPQNIKTLVYENTITRGVRTQKAYNRDEATPIPLSNELIDLLHKTDLLFFSPLLPNISPSYVKQMVDFTNKSALKVFLPQGYYRSFTENNDVVVRKFIEEKEIFPLMDIVIVSEEDSNNIHTTAKKWSLEYGILVLVTTGEKGAIAVKEGREILLPTKPVSHNEVIDSVGSGDIFSASFGYAYEKTHNIEKSGSFANDIARQCLFHTPDNITFTLPQL